MINKAKTILLVDDDADITNAIVTVFERTNWTFMQARNGKHALEIASSEHPDLIITDWEMPDGNGLDLIKALKQKADTQEIAIIMLTGMMTAPAHLEEVLDLGANDFIGKPFNEVELKARVISVLRLFDEHNEKLIIQQTLAESEQKRLSMELAYSKQILTEKMHRQACMGNKINDFIAILEQIKKESRFPATEYIERQVQVLQAEMKENLEAEYWSYFDQSHPYFFKQLQNRHPDLTAKEQKICALVMLDFSNKHIALFFSNSESTIKTTRKLLRRKLELTPDVDLSHYLKSI